MERFIEIEQDAASAVLALLRRMDNGYTPTEHELHDLRQIRKADFSNLELDILPESIGELSQLTQLDLPYNQLTSLPESIGELSQLTELNLSCNYLTTLPNSIGRLSQFTQLDLSHNQLTSLPGNISELSRLTELNLSHNQLTGLPDTIGRLSQLTELNLSYNQLTSLPDSIGRLSRLTEFSASDNQLASLPDSIGQLSRLAILDVSENQLTSLPDSIGQLFQLLGLFARHNQLTDLPDAVGQLPQLMTLFITDNQLTSLPESIGNLSQLTGLHISNNQLTSLPESIGNLSQLTGLHISNNQLTSLPDSIGQLPLSEELDISNNQLTSLPDSIGALSQITQLNVSDNQLTSLPESIGNLSRLTRLDVFDNQLTCLPDAIGQLSQLAALTASRNQLASIPGSIGGLSRLTELTLAGNQLTCLPDSIGQLSQLTALNLSNNPLSAFPECIAGLSGLTTLKIWSLGLREIPPCIRRLPNLEALDLSNNPLKTLPDWLGDMSRLRSLDLSFLRLTQLPRSLLKLGMPFLADPSAWYMRNDSRGIYIAGTELSIQPISLFDQSRDTSPDFQQSRKLIEDYFETPKDPIREAKVIFLGDGKVGKTYTIQRLLNGCRKGEYPTKETHGILIEDLYAEKDGETYKVRVWDFGGQDIMHEMHRCFLTDRTCYVVMVDTRTDKQTGRARYWLRTVQSIAPDAPVLLLVNEISGGQNRDLDYSGLQREFPNLVGVEYCSSMAASDQEFRQKVEQAIFTRALDLDSCKMELPKSWEMVRQNLLRLRSGTGPQKESVYYIDRQTFYDLCDQYSVPSDDGLRTWLLTWFNDLGVCFSYHLGENGQEQSTDYKILDPMWLTSAVYKIIWEKERNDDGLISLGEIYRILEKPGSDAMKKDGIPCLENVSYNRDECGYVLDIMRMFRISYPAGRRTEFMPTLCKPDSKLDPIPHSWVQHAAYRFRYTFLPENVLHRLMIYCFANLRPGKRWRKGFWLECEPQGLSAVIRATGRDSEENELQIDVYAQKEQYEAWTWLQPLCQQVAAINNTLSLRAETSILAEKGTEQTWFPLDTVWHWKKQGAQAMQGERNMFPISDLMSLIYGRHYPDVEMKLLAEQDEHRLQIPLERFPESFTAEVAGLAGLDMSKPLTEQTVKNLTAELRQGNELRRGIIDALQRNTGATEKNTDATEKNTGAVERSTLTLQQSNELLQAVRDGRVTLPQKVMNALVNEFRQSGQPALEAAGRKMSWCFWKNKGLLLREFLGDAANLATVAPVLFKLAQDYGPELAKLLQAPVAV